MSTNNIGFYEDLTNEDLTKFMFQLSSNIHLISSETCKVCRFVAFSRNTQTYSSTTINPQYDSRLLYQSWPLTGVNFENFCNLLINFTVPLRYESMDNSLVSCDIIVCRKGLSAVNFLSWLGNQSFNQKAQYHFQQAEFFFLNFLSKIFLLHVFSPSYSQKICPFNLF